MLTEFRTTEASERRERRRAIGNLEKMKMFGSKMNFAKMDKKQPEQSECCKTYWRAYPLPRCCSPMANYENL